MKSNETRIKQLMEQVGIPNSMSLFQAFKQLEMETALTVGAEVGAENARLRHELECLRTQHEQREYPCSPHCSGYLRELALRNSVGAEL